MLCSRCQTDSAHRSHRAGPMDYLSSLAGYYPYRCKTCGSRFRALRDRESATPAKGGVEREIAATQGASRRKNARRGILLYGVALMLFGAILYYLTREPSIGN